VVAVSDHETTPEIVHSSFTHEVFVASKRRCPDETIDPGLVDRSISVGVKPVTSAVTEAVELDVLALPMGSPHPSVSTFTRTKPSDKSSTSVPNTPLSSPHVFTVTRKLQ
jgi:hypothetical protein